MPEKLSYSKVEACGVLGISMRTLERLIRNGRIPARKFGERRVLIPADGVRSFVEGLPEATYRKKSA